MKKIVFFVEGYTEQQFIRKYICEVYDKSNVSIKIDQIRGGSKSKLKITQISAESISTNTKFCVLIYNCGSDSTIRSYINENRNSLIREGYSKILGVRDLYPDFQKHQKFELNKGLLFKLSQKDIETSFLLSILELESYFLSEHSHFNKIDSELNVNLIKEKLGFDPSTDDMEDRIHPSDDLNKCYDIVGKNYTKNASIIDNTINNLDFTEIYFKLSLKYSFLNDLKVELDTFFNV